MKYQPSGEGTSRQEGSRQATPEHQSPSPALCAASRRSPPTQRRSSGLEGTEEERTSDKLSEATPNGSKRKPVQPQAMGPQSKVTCLETGSGSTRPVAQVPAVERTATPVPTIATRVATPSVAVTLGSTAGPSSMVLTGLTLVPGAGTAAGPLDLDPPSMGQAPSADSLGQLALRTEPEAVDLGQYQWMLNTAKGHRESNLQMGFNSHRQAFDNYRRSYELETVRMTSCIGYLTNLARYLGVAPSKLTQEVQNLKQQNDQYQREAEEGQQARALREQVDKLEARNEEMEGILESMGEGLQQQTSCWATA
jgi:hypothetical protein